MAMSTRRNSHFVTVHTLGKEFAGVDVTFPMESLTYVVSVLGGRCFIKLEGMNDFELDPSESARLREWMGAHGGIFDGRDGKSDD
jgi:hypothetical protein